MPHKDPEARRAYLRRRYRNGGKERDAASKAKWQASEKGQASRAKAREAARKNRSHLKKRYGITSTNWDAMLVEQAGRCDCCNEPLHTKICVDHNHETNVVRALVCQDCNVAIGWVEAKGHKLILAEVYIHHHN